DHHRRHDGQPVQTIGQVDGVAGPDDDEVGQYDEQGTQLELDALEERQDQGGLCGGVGGQIKDHGGDQTEYRLPEILPARRQTAGVLLDHLAVVIHPADGAEADGHTQHHPDIEVAQVRPQQGTDGDGGEDQGAAHGRGTLLGQVRLGTIVAHGLADLAQLQGADHPGTEEQRHAQGSQHAEDAAQGQVLENTEAGVKLLQVLRVHQLHVGMLSASCCEPSPRAATTSTLPALREPLTRTRVRGFNSLFNAAASAALWAKLAPPRPTAAAASADTAPVLHRATRPSSRAASPTSRWACRSASPSSATSPST